MIEAPDLSLEALAPLLCVFGAACIGVLVEAFAPRDVRHPIQVAVALVGTLGALVTTLLQTIDFERQTTAACDQAELFRGRPNRRSSEDRADGWRRRG